MLRILEYFQTVDDERGRPDRSGRRDSGIAAGTAGSEGQAKGEKARRAANNEHDEGSLKQREAAAQGRPNPRE